MRGGLGGKPNERLEPARLSGAVGEVGWDRGKP